MRFIPSRDTTLVSLEVAILIIIATGMTDIKTEITSAAARETGTSRRFAQLF